MSLILDALRRADAERSRGAVPGLHTPQAMAPVALPAALPAARSRWPGLVAAFVAVGGLLALGAAWWHGRVLVAPVARVVVAPAPAPVVLPLPAPVPLPAPAVVPEPAPAPLAAPAPVRKVEPVVPKPAPAVPRAVVAPAAVSLLQDLPAAVRQLLPQLTVAGASYSANPAYRMVIVNGQVLHEGDEAVSGVVLESIAPHQVVMRRQGQRWGVSY